MLSLKEQAEDLDETRIRIRADRSAQYGAVAQVMAALNANGFRKIALVTDRSTGGSPETGAERRADQ